MNTWGTLQTNLITGNALARLPGSARVSRVGEGVLAVANFLKRAHGINSEPQEKIVAAGHRNQHARRTRYPIGYTRSHAILVRNRDAQKAKSKADITMRMARFGQYSKKFAPRKMMARISAMKYVVGKSAPNA